MNGGFWYRIPEHLTSDVEMGTRVRIPLGGRRVRGFVVECDERDGEKLKDIAGVSGEVPIFDHELLQGLMWTSQHYVAPLSVILERAAPPTLPKARTFDALDDTPQPAEHPLALYLDAVGSGQRRPVVAHVTHPFDNAWIAQCARVIGSGRSVMVVVATVTEAELMGKRCEDALPNQVVVVPDGEDSKVTRAWERANSIVSLVVGTPRLASWHIKELGLAVIVEEGRRSMKDRQTPTVHVRELLRARSRFEGFALMAVGPTPSVELLGSGAEVIGGTRPWGLVEVVDRREEPPGSGFLSGRSVAAIKATVGSDGRAFVFTHRRAGAASSRCIKCRALRRCTRCGSNIGQRSECPRCGTAAGACSNCGAGQFESMGTIPGRIKSELAGKVGRESLGDIGEGRPISVGTERDLAALHDFDLAIAVDVDALLFGHHYRSSEEALRILARLAGVVGRERGQRLILQTSNPDSALVSTLRRGDPIPYLEAVLAERVRDGFPPSTEMLAIEVRGTGAADADKLFKDLLGSMVMGPASFENGHRWLIQGDIAHHKAELGKIVQTLRDSGATIRVDVDPIDL